MTEPTHTRARAAAAVAGATLAFAAAIALRTRFDPWVTTVSAALAAIAAACWALGRAQVIALCTPTVVGVVRAALLGVALVAATHAAYHLLARWLAADVVRLYRDIDEGVPAAALAAITLVAAVAEELIWRGAALALVATDRVRAGALAVVLYAVPQIIAGEWILIVAAVGLGIVLTIQRQRTGRIVEPLVTHAIWSIAIFVVVPLR